MSSLAEHILQLSELAPPSQAGLQVEHVSIDMPIESSLAADGSLQVANPRGLMATGFDRPLGRLRFELTLHPETDHAG